MFTVTELHNATDIDANDLFEAMQADEIHAYSTVAELDSMIQAIRIDFVRDILTGVINAATDELSDYWAEYWQQRI